ncbi:MAG: hypothetical protein Q4C82_02135 [Eubacteriales bacterium]|nr:hypothetical protein [Eubacteriales bacterium]
MAGKDARFEVHVSSVQEYDLSDWNDEFIKENLNYDSQADMEASIRQELEENAQTEAESDWQYSLVEQVLSGSEYELVDSDEEQYIDLMMSEYETYAAATGMELDDYLGTYLGVTEEQLREMYRATARLRVQMTLAFHEIAQQEDLTVTDEEYESRLSELAQQYGYDDPADVEAVYSEAMIREELIQKKAMSLIVENAVRTE